MTPSRLPPAAEAPVAEAQAPSPPTAESEDAPAPKVRRRRRPRFEGTEGEGSPETKAPDGASSVE